MRKLITLLFCISLSVNISAQEVIYLNPQYKVSERVNDLISKMTLEEKVSQMVYNSPAIERLNIPSYNWWNECLHGVARSGKASVFPQPIGMAATFDDDLIYKVFTSISDEARAFYNDAIAKGYRKQYGGLTFWTPNINIFRDPRWGRGMETYGEDPFLTSRMGVSVVRGIQGEDPTYLKAAACAKHFAVHSGPERLRHQFNAKTSDKDLYETYLPAFEALVEAGVESVMCAYNRTNDDACCAHNYLLNDVLRGKWHFQGHVVSDCWALVDIYEGHKLTDSGTKAAAMSLKAGVNLNCGQVFPLLVEAVNLGYVLEEEIDRSLATLLTTRFKLGMFDPAGSTPFDTISAAVIDCKEHRAIAREVAQKSIVLLKNNGILPLKNDLSRYYVTGPNASSLESLMGNYYGVNGDMVTFYEGIVNAVANGSQVQYKPGCLLDRDNANPIDWTSGEAKTSDVTIVVLGINGYIEGEEGEAIASSHYGDRLDYNISKNQIDFLKLLRKDNKKPIITVVTGGSPMNLSEIHGLSDAVLLVWYPGEEGGNALADVLFGKVSPSGKLPVTFPMSIDQLPAYEDYSMAGRTYRYMEKEPMYPFGFGLSYSTFEFSDAELSKPKVKKGEMVTVAATLKNSGNVDADQVVQLYITNSTSKISVPLFSLKGFERVSLKAGESKEVRFDITTDMLETINNYGESILESGTYKIYVGTSLPTKRSMDLGSVKSVEFSLVVR